jgi:predicted DNA-binding transcriptional regulator AlpA
MAIRASTQPQGFYRLKTIIGDPSATPPIKPIIPVSRSSWWQGVSDGRFPPGIKIGPNTTAWRQSDIHELCESIVKGADHEK